MPVFIYRAIGRDGKIYNSKIDKLTVREVEEHIKSLKLVPIEIKKQNFFNMNVKDFSLLPKLIRKKDLSFMCRQMAFVLDSGVSIDKGVSILPEQRAALKPVLMKIENDIQKGENLSAAFAGHSIFPEFFVNMVRVGEKSGNLAQVMSWLADYYEKEHRIDEDIKSALAYPALVSFMMLNVILVSILYVIPNYAEMFSSSEMELPLATRILLGSSGFLIGNWLYVLLFILLLSVAIYHFIRGDTGRLFVDRLLLFSKVYTKVQNSKLAKALATLLVSGQNLTDSIKISSNIINNRVFNRDMRLVELEIRRGESLSKAMSKISYVDATLINMLQIGEETGQLVETTAKCASYLQNEADIMLIKLGKWVEPAVTFVLGMILAFVMLAIMLPAFYMSNIL